MPSKEDDHREYLEYKREIMEIDEKSAAEEAAIREEVLSIIEEDPGCMPNAFDDRQLGVLSELVGNDVVRMYSGMMPHYYLKEDD